MDSNPASEALVNIVHYSLDNNISNAFVNPKSCKNISLDQQLVVGNVPIDTMIPSSQGDGLFDDEVVVSLLDYFFHTAKSDIMKKSMKILRIEGSPKCVSHHSTIVWQPTIVGP